MEKLKTVLKDKKGVAGLDLALSIIAMVFVIGLLVMIYALMGSELQDTGSVAQELSTSGVADTSITVVSAGFTLTTCSTAPAGAVSAISLAYNSSGTQIHIDNFTYSGCVVSIVDGLYNTSTYGNMTYSFTQGGTAWQIINDTNTALADTPDWFPIIIVITFMVVLILLTVMIIRAIKGSGLMVGGGA